MGFDGVSVTERVLRERISDGGTVFVFPSRVAADLWAERMLRYVPAVAMERFTAWDTFKGDAVRSTRQDRRSIPAVLRKIFAQHLVSRNAELVSAGKGLFKSIINPDYASESGSFAPWIASLLPPLGSWKRTFDRMAESGRVAPDDSDRDFLVLHGEYSRFLDAHGLFDPAWEEPPFQDRGIDYVVFYPEILSDFCEYERLLRSNSRVTLVSVDGGVPAKTEDRPECLLYTNSRTELRETALFIRSLVEEGKCGYDEIVISVPEMDSWAAYIMRELDLYCIPAVLRSGRGLSSYGAGRLFAQVRQCVDTGFSFASVKELLLNRFLPWKDGEAVRLLIQFGIDNGCVCSYKAGDSRVDVWQEAFAERPGSERERLFYSVLKRHCTALCRSDSFAGLQAAYFQFRSALFNEAEFLAESDLVLGRCLAELANLIDLEASYADVPVRNHFSFFVSVLDDCEYLAQEKRRGVSVMPYRLAASAPAFCHIVPGASQSAMTVLFKQLAFLPQPKRAGLSLAESDPSAAFMELYRRHSRFPARFTCSSASFSGYSIPHSAFRVTDRKGGLPESPELCHGQDFFSAELLAFSGFGGGADSVPRTELQRSGFSAWRSGAVVSPGFSRPAAGDVSACASRVMASVCAKDGSGRIGVSQSALRDYFACPMAWLFKRVLRLSEPDVQAQLMQDLWIGTIYHDIITKYLGKYLSSGSPIERPESDGYGFKSLSAGNRELLYGHARQVLSCYRASPLTRQLLLAQENAIRATAENFLVDFTDRFGGLRVEALERELSCVPDFAAEADDVLFSGRIDCVLALSPEEFIIIDFKKGSLPEAKDCCPDGNGRLSDFQMPMYVTLWESAVKAESVAAAAFMAIREPDIRVVLGECGGRKGRPRRSADGSDGFDKTLGAFCSMAREYVEALRSMDFRQVHDVPYSTCAACQWRGVCRTTYTVSGERP